VTDQPTAEPWSPRGDRILALLPTEHPIAFDRLPFEEQQWRGRAYLMMWTYTGSPAYSWWSALRDDPSDAEAKAFVASVDDEEIAFRVAEAAQGRWYGPPEQPEVPIA
jgi:hypothetical protein